MFVRGYSTFLQSALLKHRHSLPTGDGKKEGSEGGGKRTFTVVQWPTEGFILVKKGWRKHHTSLVLSLAELQSTDFADSWAVSCAALHCLFALKPFCCGLGSPVWHTHLLRGVHLISRHTSPTTRLVTAQKLCPWIVHKCQYIWHSNGVMPLGRGHAAGVYRSCR